MLYFSVKVSNNNEEKIDKQLADYTRGFIDWRITRWATSVCDVCVWECPSDKTIDLPASGFFPFIIEIFCINQIIIHQKRLPNE